jgi:hypothetical protein
MCEFIRHLYDIIITYTTTSFPSHPPPEHHLTSSYGTLCRHVMFSSVASLIGSSGQAAYSMGNGAIDSAAAGLATKGIDALSLQWGAWAEVGLGMGW